MKKTNRNVLFLENSLMTKADFQNFMKNEYYPEVDFACINSNSSLKPIYSSRYAQNCYDPRSLFALTTDLLYFSNNKWGKNLLRLCKLRLTKCKF